MATTNGLYTTPAYIWNVSVNDAQGNQMGIAGSANYSGGAGGTNLQLFASTTPLTAGQTYIISGYKVPNNAHIEFPAATVKETVGAITYLSTTGWEVIPG